jgi:hypothetical protein
LHVVADIISCYCGVAGPFEVDAFLVVIRSRCRCCY